MKKLLLTVAATLAFLAMPLSGSAEDETVTLKGEAVDIACYLTGKSGPGHAGCAAACAAKDQPIGFVVGSGDEKVLYLVLGSGKKAPKDFLAAHMGKQIMVTGKASKKEGMPVISVAKVEAEVDAKVDTKVDTTKLDTKVDTFGAY